MPIEINVTVNRRPTQTVAEFRGRVWRGLMATAVEVKSALKASARVPINTGALRNSIDIFPRPTELRILVGSPLRYAIIQEEGRRPGQRWPPDQPIRQWILNKGLFNQALKNVVAVQKFRPSKKRTKGLAGIAGRTLGGFQQRTKAAERRGNQSAASKARRLLDQLTFAVRRKIGVKGYGGRRFFQAAAVNARPLLVANIRRAVGA